MTKARRDHYAVLELTASATQDQIKTAFRRLARASHPDQNQADATAEKRFKRISKAYEILGDPARRQRYDERLTRGRFAGPGRGGQTSFVVGQAGLYHSDLGHHSDFYQTGDPLSVTEAAGLVGRNPDWLRRAIREGRLRASRDATGYLLRRRDVERLDRTARRRSRPAPVVEDGPETEIPE
jgi:excisionase family DNA binding protein